MAYDEALAARVRHVLDEQDDVTERKMFGGLAFMVRGHMCCGVIGDDLVLRVGAEAADAALDEPHTRPMDFTGRPMKDYVYVAPDGASTEGALRRWIDLALAFTTELPPRRR
jgi:TfoX/Sxy family transcriptional regulator of competence genes